jgi:hypothetical protein
MTARASHRPYYGDGRQVYARKMPLVKTAVPFFMTTNCQRDGTGQKRAQTAVYGRLPSITLLFLEHSTNCCSRYIKKQNFETKKDTREEEV